MIAHLRGTLAAKRPPVAVIDCGGVGYQVFASINTMGELPAIGQPVELLTHLVVREDSQTLYGFTTEAERELFTELLKISGIGAKMALQILSGVDVTTFHRLIATEDAGTLTKLPGIGKKTAERLIVEMRDRIDATTGNGATRVTVEQGPRSEAVDALVALGYKPAEVNRLIARLDVDGKSAEDIIRLALRQAAS